MTDQGGPGRIRQDQEGPERTRKDQVGSGRTRKGPGRIRKDQEGPAARRRDDQHHNGEGIDQEIPDLLVSSAPACRQCTWSTLTRDRIHTSPLQSINQSHDWYFTVYYSSIHYTFDQVISNLVHIYLYCRDILKLLHCFSFRFQQLHFRTHCSLETRAWEFSQPRDFPSLEIF